MGKDKNLFNTVLFIDLTLLLIVSSVYFFLLKLCSPETLEGVTWFSMTVTCLISFYISSQIYPAVATKRMVKSEQVVRRVTITSILFLFFTTIITTCIRPGEIYPRFFIYTLTVIFFISLLIERLAIRQYLSTAREKRQNQKLVVFVGYNHSIYEIFKMCQKPINGYTVVGAFFDDKCQHSDFCQYKKGNQQNIYEWLLEHEEIDEIYCYLHPEKRDEINMMNKFCDNHLIRFYYVPCLDVFNTSMTFSMFGNIPIVTRREEPLTNPYNRLIKRAFDIIVSSLFLCTLYPLIYIFVAIMIKIKSPGPIYFKQSRTGLDGVEFKCIKFRSMKVNADSDKVQATKDDPRKYPFGNFMRKTNIDELPQFINVWKGEMSIVGPRPHMLRHTEEYSKLINRFMLRHFAKPGITGLAQVSGFRGETKYIDQMEGRVQKDIEYIENWTFLLDIKIMIKTVTNMFEGEKNAY